MQFNKGLAVENVQLVPENIRKLEPQNRKNRKTKYPLAHNPDARDQAMRFNHY
jgi:hypothetical protein